MSVLMNLRRLLTARKAWRVFTTKLQSKLHKLNRSKAMIKKHKKKKKKKDHHELISTTCSKASTLWPFLSFQSRFQGKSRLHRQIIRSNVHPVKYKPRHPSYQKKSAPVYIDELFIEAAGAGKKTSPPHVKKGRVVNYDEAAAAAGAGTSSSSNNKGGGGKSHIGADDMWESLVLASPQMHGINERAEEFISRFRAEMQVQQEMLGGAHL